MAVPRWKWGIEEKPKPEPQPVRKIPRWKRDSTRPPVKKEPIVVSRAKDQTVSAPYDYLKQHTRGKARHRLIQSERVPGAKGKYAASMVASRLAFGSMPLSKKEEYGFKFTDWESIPASERGKYYGGSRHLRSLPKEKQRELGKQYFEEETKEGLGDFNISEFGTMMAGEDLSTIYSGDQKVWREKQYEYMFDKLSTPPGKLKDKYFAKMPDPVKWFTSGSHAAISWAAFPITLPQAGVKLLTGKGDIFQRLQTGKTLILPDVGKSLERHRPGSPLDIMSVGMSEGIGALTGKGSDEWARFQREPISGIFATAGAGVGYLTGATALKIGVGATYKYTHMGLNKLRIKADQSRFIKDTWATSGIGKPKYPLTLSEWQASMYKKGMIWDYTQGGYTKLGQKSIVEQQLSTISKRTVSTMTRPKISFDLHKVYPVYTKPATGFSLKMKTNLWTNIYVKPLAKTLTYALPISAVLAKTLTKTQPLTQTLTKTQPLTKVKPLTLTKVKPLTLTKTKVQVQPFTATKIQTQTLTKTQPLTKLKTMTEIKVKPKLPLLDFPRKSKKKKKSFFDIAPPDFAYHERIHPMRDIEKQLNIKSFTNSFGKDISKEMKNLMKGVM